MKRRRSLGMVMGAALAFAVRSTHAHGTTQADNDKALAYLASTRKGGIGATKAKAPEPLVPTNRFGSPDGSLKHFTESRATTEDFLKKTPDLRAHAADSPLGSKLDAYEWVLFIAAHSERHTKQILEVKANEK